MLKIRLGMITKRMKDRMSNDWMKKNDRLILVKTFLLITPTENVTVDALVVELYETHWYNVSDFNDLHKTFGKG